MPHESGPAPRIRDASRHGVGERDVAFGELADRFRGPIHLLCYRLIGSFEEAIQLTYDTFLTGWRLRGSAADRKDWLMAIAVRACVDHVRRRRRPHAQSTPHQT